MLFPNFTRPKICMHYQLHEDLVNGSFSIKLYAMANYANQDFQRFVSILLMTLSTWFVEALSPNHTNCATLATGTCKVTDVPTEHVFYEIVYTPYVLKLSWTFKVYCYRKNLKQVFQTLEDPSASFRYHTDQPVCQVHQTIWPTITTIQSSQSECYGMRGTNGDQCHQRSNTQVNFRMAPKLLL